MQIQISRRPGAAKPHVFRFFETENTKPQVLSAAVPPPAETSPEATRLPVTYNQQATRRGQPPLRAESIIRQICTSRPQCAAGTLHAALPCFMAPGAASCTTGVLHSFCGTGNSGSRFGLCAEIHKGDLAHVFFKGYFRKVESVKSVVDCVDIKAEIVFVFKRL